MGRPKRSTDMNALLIDAQIKLSKKGCANSMGHRSNDAAAKDV